MKRTNLVLDESLLKEAREVLGAKTYSEAVNQALREIIRIGHIKGFTKWFGTKIWEGDLSEMREDRTSTKRR